MAGSSHNPRLSSGHMQSSPSRMRPQGDPNMSAGLHPVQGLPARACFHFFDPLLGTTSRVPKTNTESIRQILKSFSFLSCLYSRSLIQPYVAPVSTLRKSQTRSSHSQSCLRPGVHRARQLWVQTPPARHPFVPRSPGLQVCE